MVKVHVFSFSFLKSCIQSFNALNAKNLRLKAKSHHLMDQIPSLIIDSQKYFPEVYAGIEVVIKNSQQLIDEKN